jgi:predicted RNase H-like HicB family nuclease
MTDLRHIFRVVAWPEGAQWLADVPELPGAQTFAAAREELDHQVRSVIALVLDLPGGAEGQLNLHYEWWPSDPRRPDWR